MRISVTSAVDAPAPRTRSAPDSDGAAGIVMIYVLAEDQPQMPFAGDQHPVETLAAGAGDPAFGNRVCAEYLDRRLMIRAPTAVNIAPNAAVNLVSRFRIKNFNAASAVIEGHPQLCVCWVTHSPVGWVVIPARCTPRVPCSMKNSGYQAITRSGSLRA